MNRLYLSVLLGGLVSSCATVQLTPKSFVVDTSRIPADVPAALHKGYWPVVAGQDRDIVVNRLNFSSLALRSGEFNLARRSLDLSLADITSVFSNKKNAKKAVKLWYEEGMKDFKGEPYERAMAFYYRGLLYALEGEYDNARASFEAGFQQDSVAVDSETVADFASLLFLKSWAAYQMRDGDLALADWREFRQYVTGVSHLNAEKLVIIETGSAPRKLADGIGHYELVYRRGKGYQPNRLDILNDRRKPYMLEDIFVQAITRGQRPVDRIIKGKAQFMNRALAAGTVLSDLGDASNRVGFWTGAFGARNVGSGAGYASDALNVAGAVSLLMAAAANPRVDTRYWEGLPDRVYIVQLPKNESLQDSTWKLSYPDGFSYSQAATETVVAVSDTLEWYRIPHRFRYSPPVFYR